MNVISSQAAQVVLVEWTEADLNAGTYVAVDEYVYCEHLQFFLPPNTVVLSASLCVRSRNGETLPDITFDTYIQTGAEPSLAVNRAAPRDVQDAQMLMEHNKAPVLVRPGVVVSPPALWPLDVPLLLTLAVQVVTLGKADQVVG